MASGAACPSGDVLLRFLCRSGCVLVFALALAGPGHGAPAGDPPPDAAAATPADELQEIETEIAAGKARLDALNQQADTLATESADLQRQLIEAADKVQGSEQALSEIEARLFALLARQDKIVASLAHRRDEIAALTGALESLALNRPPTLGVTPDDATEAARSAMLLNALIPQLAQEADALEGELADLKKLRENIDREQSEAVAAAKSLDNERVALKRKVDEMALARDTTMASAAAEQDRLSALAHHAADIRQFLTMLTARGLDATPRPKPEASEHEIAASGGQIAALKGRLRPPVTGPVSLAFGADIEDGGKNRGIYIAARPEAQVVAPCDGTVVFSGPFRGYGLLLIIRSDDGYHFVLSGMSRIDAVARQKLLTGEPIGVMGKSGNQPGTDPAGPGAKGDGPHLYVELRHDGDPIDPEPWFAMSGKVSG